MVKNMRHIGRLIVINISKDRYFSLNISTKLRNIRV